MCVSKATSNKKRIGQMNTMYSVDQIQIPPEIGTIMKQYTKAVMRDKPQDVYKYSANFFAALCGRPAPFDENGQLVEKEQNDTHSGQWAPHDAASHDREQAEDMTVSDDTVLKIFQQYDNGSGKTSVDQLESIMQDIREVLQLEKEDLPTAEEIVSLVHVEDDLVDLLDLKQLLFEGTN